MQKHPKGKGCWYKTTIYGCPVCGREEVFRQRQWTPRPENKYDQYEYVYMYDWCDV